MIIMILVSVDGQKNMMRDFIFIPYLINNNYYYKSTDKPTFPVSHFDSSRRWELSDWTDISGIEFIKIYASITI